MQSLWATRCSLKCRRRQETKWKPSSCLRRAALSLWLQSSRGRKFHLKRYGNYTLRQWYIAGNHATNSAGFPFCNYICDKEKKDEGDWEHQKAQKVFGKPISWFQFPDWWGLTFSASNSEIWSSRKASAGGKSRFEFPHLRRSDESLFRYHVATDRFNESIDEQGGRAWAEG